MSDRDTKPEKSRQLKLDFPEAVLSLDTLSISSSNRTAIGVLKRWPDWRQPALALVGTPKSGLTTAAQAWADHSGGKLVHARAFDRLSHKQVEALAAKPLAVDLGEAVSNEDNLLSIINLSARYGGSLLLTGHVAPARWRVRLPDLASRLKSMTLVEIGLPDDEMVVHRLDSAMKRRYLKLPKEVEDYLLTRLERNYSTLETFVESLHEQSDGREITVPLAREVLERIGGTRPLFDEEED